jgi:hypothetical protein
MKKTGQKMANHTQDSPQQLPSQDNKNTQETNRIQQYNQKTTKKHRKEKEQMNYIHVLHSTNQKDYQPLQTYRHKYSLQKQQQHTTTNQQGHNQQNTEIQIQWNLRTNM